VAFSASPAPPKEPEVPANREEIQGNLYTNYTHGFRMYKAPSWSLIEEARGALPNAIVAMGTSNESTLLVVGEEKTKESLDAAAAAVEKRLQDVYVNYRRVSSVRQWLADYQRWSTNIAARRTSTTGRASWWLFRVAKTC